MPVLLGQVPGYFVFPPAPLLLKMASGLDSNAYFLERVHGVGLGDFVVRLEALGITSMAEFAFSANYVPGRSDETGLMN